MENENEYEKWNWKMKNEKWKMKNEKWKMKNVHMICYNEWIENRKLSLIENEYYYKTYE